MTTGKSNGLKIFMDSFTNRLMGEHWYGGALDI